MSQTDVQCTHNTIQIQAVVDHVEGGQYTVYIEAQKALVDATGCIRFFTLTYDDGDTQGYLLHPYAAHVPKPITWALDFLAGYGLSRLGSKLIKPKQGVPAAHAEAVMMGRYFTFSNPGGQLIRSYMKHFLPQHLGYHNVLTDKLIFTNPLYVDRWR